MMNRIPKKAYTTEFKELAVKRVSDGELSLKFSLPYRISNLL